MKYRLFKRINRKKQMARIPVIVATQMMETMITSLTQRELK
jgi:pyruvate kinase